MLKIIRIKIFFYLVLFSNLTFAKTHEIKMLNSLNGQSMVFSPQYLEIAKGDNVTFIPTNSGHNTRSVFIAEKAKNWHSQDNKKITIKFSHEGFYIYECTNHRAMAMAGVIKVGSGQNFLQAKKFYQSYKKKFIINKNRLDYIFK